MSADKAAATSIFGRLFSKKPAKKKTKKKGNKKGSLAEMINFGGKNK